MTTIDMPIFCEKGHNSFPDDFDENSFEFFKFPVWNEPRFEKYTADSLACKFNGIENISQPILQEIREEKKIHSSFEILDPPIVNSYAPTLKYMQNMVSYYQEKYQISIQCVFKEEAAALIEKMVNSERPSSGIIIFGKGVFHVTPVIVYKGDPEGHADILIMDCTHRKKINSVLNSLIKILPEHARLGFANKTRLGGRYFCRTEAMSLLKYALLCIQRKGDVKLSSYLDTRFGKSLKSGREYFDFEVPRQWSPGSNLTRAVTLSPALIDHPINRKEETYDVWTQRHPFTNARVKVVAMNEDRSIICQNEFEKSINLFLVEKVNKLIKKVCVL